jgi:hypothetical protein
VYQLPDHLCGKTVRCKSCSQAFVVPGGAARVKTHPRASGPAPRRTPRDPEKSANSKKSAGRKKSPAAFTAVLVVVFLMLLGGAGGAYLWLSGDATASTQAANKPRPPAQSPPAQQPAATPDSQQPNGPDADADLPETKKPAPVSYEPKPPPKPATDVPVENAEKPKAEQLPSTVEISFSKHVQPFLNTYCGNCHKGPGSKAGINLESFASIMRGGKNKQPMLIAGEPDKSNLVRVVEGKGKRLMPPANRKQPGAEEKGLLRKWVAAGAKDDTVKAGLDVLLLDPRLPLELPMLQWNLTRSVAPPASGLGSHSLVYESRGRPLSHELRFAVVNSFEKSPGAASLTKRLSLIW